MAAIHTIIRSKVCIQIIRAIGAISFKSIGIGIIDGPCFHQVIGFVNHIIGKLGLENAEAVKGRAEDYAPGNRFDTVIARALATVPRLVELSAHLVGEDGQLLALKGKYPAEELEVITKLPEWEFTVTSVEVPGLEAHARHVVILQRKKTRS